MFTPKVTETTFFHRRPIVDKGCVHEDHVGWCPHCQRYQQKRWSRQLAIATAIAAQHVTRREVD